jgi:hypothetical protein
MKYKVVKIKVDTNDGDYEDHYVKIEDICPDKINLFFDTLKYLPVEEDYYYWDGERKVRGNHIRWGHDRVGNCLDYEECALKSMMVSDEDFSKDGWTIEDVRQEGMITESEYNLLCEFFPMYVNEGFGFHTIKEVNIEMHTEPEIIYEHQI